MSCLSVRFQSKSKVDNRLQSQSPEQTSISGSHCLRDLCLHCHQSSGPMRELTLTQQVLAMLAYLSDMAWHGSKQIIQFP